VLNWSGRPDPDGNLYIFHKSDAPQNYGRYANKQVDALLDEARTVSDPKERKAIYEKVAGTVLSEGSLLYLYHRLWIVAHTAKVDGLKLLPDGLVRVVGLKLK
jgi:peptide/nickel transport system substrate-binding protein